MALLPCPECKRNISDQAMTCPHCGHPIRITASKSKFTQDVEDVKTIGAWLAFLITLPTLAVPAIISTLLGNPGELNEEAIKTLWDTFLLTAPLTCAIAIMGVWVPTAIKAYNQANQGKKWQNPGEVAVIGVGMLLSLWLAAGISQFFLKTEGVDVWEAIRSSSSRVGGSSIVWLSLWTIFLKYFEIYGVYNFLSSLAIGLFLAWIWNKKILSYF